MSESGNLSISARQLREGDNDRFLTALFAPSERRAGLFTLYAFNLELARIADLVSEPMMGHIRLQWWRDRIGEIYDGEPPNGAELTRELCQTARAHDLPRASFEAMLDAREQDLSPDPPATLDEFESYAEATSGTLVSLALHILGVAEQAAHDAGRHIGMAWAIAGHLRAAAFHSRRNKLFLPADMLDGEAAAHLQNGRSSPVLAIVARRLMERAEAHLTAARELAPRVPKAALPALLLGPLASAYLRRLSDRRYDLFSSELDIAKPRRQVLLAWSAWRGRY